jgi:hypothetical protein
MQRKPKMILDEATLRRLYEVERHSIEAIAAMYERCDKPIRRLMKLYGIASRHTGPLPGPEHPQWRGGISVDAAGYIERYCPNHPFSNHKYVRENRLVMEGVLGRYLKPGEVVHHKDGDKANNNPDNLELFATNAEHLAKTLKGKCPKWTERGRRAMQEMTEKKKIRFPPLEQMRQWREVDGLSAPEIARRCGCGRGTVERYIRHHKLHKARKTHLSDWTDAALQIEYDKHGSLAHQTLGVSVGAFYWEMKRRGIPLRRPPKTTQNVTKSNAQ